MQKLFFVIGVMFVGFHARSQNSDQITSWVQNNPNVVLIESESFQNFSQEEIAKLNSNFIVYSQELKESDILAYSKLHNLDFNTPVNNVSTDELKSWLAQNPNLKIVTKSEFERESEAVQAEYIANKCLILTGDTVTLVDIHNYKF